jgi:hypothetical protein
MNALAANLALQRRLELVNSFRRHIKNRMRSLQVGHPCQKLWPAPLCKKPSLLRQFPGAI